MELSPAQASVIKKLKGDRNVDDLSVHPTATLAAMDARYSFSSTRVVLAALKKMYPACKEFAAESKKRREQYKKLDESQEPTDKQREKFVAWADVLAFRDEYRSQMSQAEYFLMCLYTMWAPVRADYTPMEVVTRKPRTLKDGTNYLIVRPKSIDCLFHAYKTHEVYGDQLRKMPKALEAVTRQWLDTHAGDAYLFQDEAGNPWQPQRLGATLRRVFQRFHGMDTGISTLRHSYATHLYKGMPALKELKRLSSAMMHSVTQAQAYRHIELE